MQWSLNLATADDAWRMPPPTIHLPSNEIHLWRIDLDSMKSWNRSGQSFLSTDEIARARRFHFQRDQKRFICTRIALRTILAGYVPFPPEAIEFVCRTNGKPELVSSQNPVSLQLSVSHSGSFAIIGVVLGRRIGVDIEQYRIMEFLEIARRYFSEREYQELSASPAEDLQKNFFACWTRKEAFLKALGEGIGSLLSQVSVTTAYRECPKLLEFQIDPAAPWNWSFVDLQIHLDYTGALAFEHGPLDVRRWIFV